MASETITDWQRRVAAAEAAGRADMPWTGTRAEYDALWRDGLIDHSRLYFITA